MRALAFLALTLLALSAPSTGSAHLFHANEIVVLIDQPREDPKSEGENLIVGVHVVNGTGNAVTLRGITLDGHGTLDVERLRDFLLFKTWQQVQFLRVDPGEVLSLAQPSYRIVVPTDAWRSDFRITADFGPAGQIDIQGALPVQRLYDAVGE